jgi:hypothetical protein
MLTDLHQEIRQRLWEDLQKAQAAHLAASRRFDLLVKEGPSGLPHPDGALRVQQVGRESRAALQGYMQALKPFTEFIALRHYPGRPTAARLTMALWFFQLGWPRRDPAGAACRISIRGTNGAEATRAGLWPPAQLAPCGRAPAVAISRIVTACLSRW